MTSGRPCGPARRSAVPSTHRPSLSFPGSLACPSPCPFKGLPQRGALRRTADAAGTGGHAADAELQANEANAADAASSCAPKPGPAKPRRLLPSPHWAFTDLEMQDKHGDTRQRCSFVDMTLNHSSEQPGHRLVPVQGGKDTFGPADRSIGAMKLKH